MEYKSVMVSAEVDLIADLSLHIRDVLPLHYLSFPLLNEVCLPLYGRPVNLFLVFRVVDLQEVLVLLHKAIVHLRGVPFVQSVVKLCDGGFWIFASHILTDQDKVYIFLYGWLFVSLCLLLVVLFVVYHCLEKGFVEDQLLMYLPTNVRVQLIHLAIVLFRFRPALGAVLSGLPFLGHLGYKELFKIDIVIGNFILPKIAEVALILALLSLPFIVVAGKHFAHIQSLSLSPEIREKLRVDGVISLGLIFLIMEESFLVFIELSLKAYIQLCLRADKGLLEFVVQAFGVALEVGPSSRFLLTCLEVVELVDVEVLPATFVHGGGDEALLELGGKQC